MLEEEDATLSPAADRLRLVLLVAAAPTVGYLVARAVAEGPFATALGSLSLAAGAFVLALLVLIWAAGAAASSSREALLVVFRPGLYLTAVSLVLLVLAHGAIVIAVVLRFFRPIGFLLAIGVGALAGAVAIVRSVFSVVRKAESHVIGFIVPEDAGPRLWSHVREIADRMGALHPQHIVVGLDPNFFVTEAEVTSLSGAHSGRTLYCSLPLMRILERRQFSSIVGHELGHFKGADTRFSEKFYPIYRGTAAALLAMTSGESEDASRLALLPAIAILSYFMETFSVAERRLSRARELAADAEGAGVSDRRTAAAALVKVHAFAPLWGSILDEVGESLKARSMFVNLSETFVEETGTSERASLLAGISDRHLEHPTDSHPPLEARLEALGVSLDDVTADGLRTVASDPAIELLDEPRGAEKKLSIAYQEFLAQFLGIDLESMPASFETGHKSRWSAKKRRERMSSRNRRR
jgi:Zn-dependent protease with chaperone function